MLLFTYSIHFTYINFVFSNPGYLCNFCLDVFCHHYHNLNNNSKQTQPGPPQAHVHCTSVQRSRYTTDSLLVSYHATGKLSNLFFQYCLYTLSLYAEGVTQNYSHDLCIEIFFRLLPVRGCHSGFRMVFFLL